MMSNKAKASIESVLKQLQAERQRIEGAISNLEGLMGNLVSSATTGVKRRGRPPKAASQAVAVSRKATGRAKGERLVARQRSRAGWTDDARAAAAERMQAYWAERRKAKEAGKSAPSPRRPRGKAASAEPAVAANDSRERSRKGWTPEAREAARARMRTYWQQRRDANTASG